MVGSSEFFQLYEAMNWKLSIPTVPGVDIRRVESSHVVLRLSECLYGQNTFSVLLSLPLF